MIGLNRKVVKLMPYCAEWSVLFDEEERLLRSAIGSYALAIEHIGSTSIPELEAKPIIDIAVAVRKIEDAERCLLPLENIGYEYRGEQGIAERYYFRKGTPTVSTHHLNIVEVRSEFWRNHLLFRDYLRQHSDVAQEYGRLKRELACEYKENREAYTNGKAAFIEQILRRASSSKRAD